MEIAPTSVCADCAPQRAGVERPPPERSGSAQALYPRLLDWAFNVFSSTRIITYLPTLWAICASGDSSQHSLLTWGAWVGSNLSMAAWLYEKNGRRVNKAVVVTFGNGLMCAMACAVIIVFRV